MDRDADLSAALNPFHDAAAVAVEGNNIADELPHETAGMIHDIASMVEETTDLQPSLLIQSDLPILTNADEPAIDRKIVSEAAGVKDDAVEIWEPEVMDVLTGRGASINVHPGNQKFRALCYARKSQFEAANHAAKKRIATEIWTTCEQLYNSRFLSKRQEKGPWYQQSAHHAILKAAQTIRDYQRPDRLLQRDFGGNKKRRSTPATPMDEVVVPPPPEGPIVECPEGVEANDVLCGRGAFVNGHKGNQYLRQLAMARKAQFDSGTYSEKRLLATEIVSAIKDLDPPGRFLRRLSKPPDKDLESATLSFSWEELDVEKSIHKACQVMRDIDRQDRKHRLERKMAKMNRMQNLYSNLMDENKEELHDVDIDDKMDVIQHPDVEGVLDAIVAGESDAAAKSAEDILSPV